MRPTDSTVSRLKIPVAATRATIAYQDVLKGYFLLKHLTYIRAAMRQHFCAAVWIRVCADGLEEGSRTQNVAMSRDLWENLGRCVRVDGMEMFNLSHEVMPQTTSLDGSALVLQVFWCSYLVGEIEWAPTARPCAWSLFDTLESSSSSRHVSNLLETKGGPSCQGRQEGMVPEGNCLQHGRLVRRVL